MSGTHLLTVQEPRVRAKYRGIETTNVSASCAPPHPTPASLPTVASSAGLLAFVPADMPGDQ